MLAAAETLAVDVADAQALKARAAGGDREALRAAARQFESLMVAQMLKTMRQTRFNDEDDPLTGGESMKLYRDLLDQQWAAKMANGRGLGFADMLTKHLERQAGFSDDAGGKSPAAEKSVPQSGNGAPGTATISSPTGGGGREGVAGIPTTSRSISSPTGGGGREGEAAAPSPARPLQTPAKPETPATDRKQRFLEIMRPHAEAAEAATGVPARFILAQAALESGWGDREIRDAAGQASHNLFGVKAGRGWSGEAVETTTTEYRQGVAMKLTQSFRSYADYGEAFADYADLLKRRFGEATAAGGDAEAFAKGLAEGGYATDPAYAGKLKAVIASVAMAGV
jgi:flagellar protein FlgJ